MQQADNDKHVDLDTDFERGPDLIVEFINLLLDDITAAHNDMQERDTPYTRRTYVRTIFAAIEGYVHFLKQSALDDLVHGQGHFSAVEEALLRELRYDLTENGEVKIQPATIPLISNLRFALSAFTRSSPPQFDLQLKDKNWDVLREAVRKVRNRLIHPKKLDDLNVSDEDLALVDQAFSWVDGIVRRAYVHTYTIVIDTFRELISELEDLKKLTRALEEEKDMSTQLHDQVDSLSSRLTSTQEYMKQSIKALEQTQRFILGGVNM